MIFKSPSTRPLRPEPPVDVTALPQARLHCTNCHGVRVFFRLAPTPRTGEQWICFSCRQPRGGWS